MFQLLQQADTDRNALDFGPLVELCPSNISDDEPTQALFANPARQRAPVSICHVAFVTHGWVMLRVTLWAWVSRMVSYTHTHTKDFKAVLSHQSKLTIPDGRCVAQTRAHEQVCHVWEDRHWGKVTCVFFKANIKWSSMQVHVALSLTRSCCCTAHFNYSFEIKALCFPAVTCEPPWKLDNMMRIKGLVHQNHMETFYFALNYSSSL